MLNVFPNRNSGDAPAYEHYDKWEMLSEAASCATSSSVPLALACVDLDGVVIWRNRRKHSPLFPVRAVMWAAISSTRLRAERERANSPEPQSLQAKRKEADPTSESGLLCFLALHGGSGSKCGRTLSSVKITRRARVYYCLVPRQKTPLEKWRFFGGEMWKRRLVTCHRSA